MAGALAQLLRTPFRRMSQGQVVKTMKDLGNGATGIIFLRRSEGAGHYFNVVNKNGEIQFWCGQGMEMVSARKNLLDYFNNGIELNLLITHKP